MKEERAEKKKLAEELEIDPETLGEEGKKKYIESKKRFDEICKGEIQRIIF